MLEINKIRPFYQQKRIIWVQGPEGTRQKSVLERLAEGVSVSSVRDRKEDQQSRKSLVLWVTPSQFNTAMELGSSRSNSATDVTYLIDGFEHQDEHENREFLNCLLIYRQFRNHYPIRVMLSSGPNFGLEKRFRDCLRPVVVRIRGIGDDPNDLNERIHHWIEQASRVAQKRVTGLSENAAKWLESRDWNRNDDELLEHLIFSMMQMGEETVLQLHHLTALGRLRQRIRLEDSEKTVEISVI